MNLRNLEYFIAVAEELSFTKSAEKYFISQQAMSKHIAGLEEEFGVKLLNRTQPINLTAAGEALLVHAKRLITELTDIGNELMDVGNSMSGEISIGVTKAKGSILLPMVLPLFQETYPNVRIHLVEEYTRVIESALRKREIDVLIGHRIRNSKSVAFSFLCEEAFYVILPQRFLSLLPEEDQRKLFFHPTVNLALLRHCPFIKVFQGWASELFDEYCAERNLNMKIALESQNIDTCIRLSVAGMGVFVCPQSFLLSLEHHVFSESGENKVYLLPFGYPNFSNSIGISYNTDKYMSKPVRALLDLAKQMKGQLQKQLGELRSSAEKSINRQRRCYK